MENIVIKEASKIFDVSSDKIKVVKRLLGGRSNVMFLFERLDTNELFTFRILGKNANMFVDRDIELKNLEIIKQLNLNSEVIFFDTKTGYKISKYIEGDCLTALNVSDYYTKVANLLHRLHDSSIKASNDYLPFERLEKYESFVKELGFKEDRSAYLNTKNEFLTYRKFLEDDRLTITHGDSQTDNMILDENGKLFLLDWEFTGNNYAFYDIACFGDKDFDNALKLLEIYLNHPPKSEDFKRLYLWRAFQCLQWHNVALYKHLIGLGDELKVDFKFFADLYVTKAIKFLNEAKK